MSRTPKLASCAGAVAAVAFAVSGVRKCPKVVALGASNKINDFHRPSLAGLPPNTIFSLNSQNLVNL